MSSDEKKDFNWVRLAVLGGEVELQLLMGLLDTYGIKSQKVYPGITQAMKVYAGTAIGVELYVLEEDIDRAKEILKEVEK